MRPRSAFAAVRVPRERTSTSAKAVLTAGNAPIAPAASGPAKWAAVSAEPTSATDAAAPSAVLA